MLVNGESRRGCFRGVQAKQSRGISFVPLLSFALCAQGKCHAYVYFSFSSSLPSYVLVQFCAFQDGRVSRCEPQC